MNRIVWGTCEGLPRHFEVTEVVRDGQLVKPSGKRILYQAEKDDKRGRYWLQYGESKGWSTPGSTLEKLGDYLFCVDLE